MAKLRHDVLNRDTGATMTDSEVIEMALVILNHRFSMKRTTLNSPKTVREYLQVALSDRQHEVFVCAFVDAQQRVIALEELFRGTLTQTSVYPREVVKRALHHNCAGVIFGHNHPSGVAEPSRADELLTATLKHALALVDVSVVDHFVVAGAGAISFAERGLI